MISHTVSIIFIKQLLVGQMYEKSMLQIEEILPHINKEASRVLKVLFIILCKGS